MNPKIVQTLQPIFRDVFDDDSIVINENMTAADVVGWDSFNHIQLVLSVERAFKVKFTASEITSLKNVGQFVELIQSKL